MSFVVTSPSSTEPDGPDLPDRRKLLIGVAFLAFFGLAAIALSFRTGTGEDGAVATADDATRATIAELPLATVDDETVTLASYQGTPVVLNFFAAYCAPCRAELPDFEEVSQARGEAVTFLGVSRDVSRSPWLSLVNETGITFETVFEGTVSGIYTELGATAMPTTVFLSADGSVLHIHAGPLTADRLDQLIDEYFYG